MGNDGGDTRSSRVRTVVRDGRDRVAIASSASLVASLAALLIALPVAMPADGAQRDSDRPQKAGKGGAHGAIAYNQKTGTFGFSYDYPVARAAKESALARCAEPECVVMVNFRNACAALVQGAKRPFVSQGITRDEASTRAMNKCGDEARCKPVAWACTR